MAGTPHTNQELAQQVVLLGQQVTQLQQQLAAAQQSVQDLQARGGQGGGSRDKAWAGLVGRKHMMLDTLMQRDEFKEWAEAVIDYIENGKILEPDGIDVIGENAALEPVMSSGPA